MAEYRTVRMSYWTDPYVEELDSGGKLLYLYLITCPATNNIGVMEITQKRIAYETGLPLSAVSGYLQRMESSGKIVTDGNIIWLVKFVKHQTTTSPKLLQSLRNIFPEITSEKIRHAICLGYPHIFDDCEKNKYVSDTVSIPYQHPIHTVGIPSGEEEREEEEENKKERVNARAHIERPSGEAGEAGEEEKTEETQETITPAPALPSPGTLPQKTDSPSKGNPQYSAFKTCYSVYPVQQGEEDAWREWMRLYGNRTLPECSVVYDAILLLSGEDDRWRDGYVPAFVKWLRGKGWNDKPYHKPVAASRASPGQQEKPRASTVYQQRLSESQDIATQLLKSKGVIFDGKSENCGLNRGKIIDVQDRVSGADKPRRALAANA